MWRVSCHKAGQEGMSTISKTTMELQVGGNRIVRATVMGRKLYEVMAER